MPCSPMLHTSTRNRTVECPVDQDEVELKKKFHAQPVNRKIFENSPTKPNRPKSVPVATVVSHGPVLSTSARARKSPFELEHEQQEQEYQRRADAIAQRRRSSQRHNGLTAAKTPKLKSLQRHQQYQEKFENQRIQEEEQERRQRHFRAQPMRALNPPRFPRREETPLTEPQPFNLPGEQRHRRAQERFSQKILDEKERTKKESQVKARPMPDLSKAFVVSKSDKPLTEVTDKVLASDIQALKRYEYDAQDRERRDQAMAARAEAQRKEAEHDALELKRLRSTQLQFHAQPIRGKNEYQVKPSEKDLTVPQSPSFLHRAKGNHHVAPHAAAAASSS